MSLRDTILTTLKEISTRKGVMDPVQATDEIVANLAALPMEIADGQTPDLFGRVWPKGYEVCPVCGQPDNCGDCTHDRLSDDNVLEIVSGIGEPITDEARAVLPS